MDHIRQELDQLMGKDRNKPLFVRLARRDHYDDQDVSVVIIHVTHIANHVQLFASVRSVFLISFITLCLDLQVQLALILPKRPVPQHQGRYRSV